MWTDGIIYALIALFGALSASMGSDEAAKWLEPETLFWTRVLSNNATAVLLAVKMFRSTAYANYLKEQPATTAVTAVAISTADVK